MTVQSEKTTQDRGKSTYSHDPLGQQITPIATPTEEQENVPQETYETKPTTCPACHEQKTSFTWQDRRLICSSCATQDNPTLVVKLLERLFPPMDLSKLGKLDHSSAEYQGRLSRRFCWFERLEFRRNYYDWKYVS